ncbi:hypothetical protein Goari_006545 [Gossypium aridum]|uniref:Uncharacterized protein n=1 Tax=Gossypium aridum TaxID=34290 RepID=A0A7J8XN87_GOSAI|nr:hypothetical protein [Gossypium aridum]
MSGFKGFKKQLEFHFFGDDPLSNINNNMVLRLFDFESIEQALHVVQCTVVSAISNQFFMFTSCRNRKSRHYVVEESLLFVACFPPGDQNHRKKLNSDVTFEICIAELDCHLARKFYKKSWDCKIGDSAGKEMTMLTEINDINPRAFICDFILTVVRGGERKTEEER